jgi:hypothetical protein
MENFGRYWGFDPSVQGIVFAALGLALLVGGVFVGFVLFLNKRLNSEQQMIDKLQEQGRLHELLPEDDED